jgi:Beta propeller domain
MECCNNEGEMMHGASMGPTAMWSDSDDGSAPSEGTGNNFKASHFNNRNPLQDFQEPDIVQSNGRHVFAVCGDEILELDATMSTLLRRTVLPVDCYRYQNIHSMLLVDEHLVVIVMVYSLCLSPTVGSSSATAAPNDQPILRTDDKTRIIMYAIDTMEIETVYGGYIDSPALVRISTWSHTHIS